MDTRFGTLGAAFGALAVAAGAYGTHGRLAPDMAAIYEVAVRYQMYHALALLAVALFLDRSAASIPNIWAVAAGWLFAAGIVLFSGSLYALSLGGATAFQAIPPLGGVAFIAGWLCLAVAAFRARA